MTHRISPPRPRRPRAVLPAGACDCHAHVFAPPGVYSHAEFRPYTPAAGTGLAAYRAMLGGIRINLEFPGETTLDDLTALGPRLARLGWHLQMLVKAARLPAIAERLLALPVDLVIDHMGLPSAEAGLAGVWPLLPLLATGRVWVELSAPCYVTSQLRPGAPQQDRGAPPDHRLATAIARRLFEARPDRMLWGSNWPHPHSAPVPVEGDLVDWLAEVVGDDAGLYQVMVLNPARLCGFDAP